MQWSNDTALEQELLSLKKAKLGLDSALANEKNERAKVTTEVAESKRKHKEDIFKVGHSRKHRDALRSGIVLTVIEMGCSLDRSRSVLWLLRRRW